MYDGVKKKSKDPAIADIDRQLEKWAEPSPSSGKGDVASQRAAIERGAAELQIDPVDYATAMSYESARSFDPWVKGPVTKWGQHRGTIQYGEPQQKQYGVYKGQSFEDQVTTSNVKYLRDAGVKPGMKFAQIYAAINGGSAKPSSSEFLPFSILSAPRLGPITRFSMICISAASAPARKSNARFFASCVLGMPEI